MPKPKKSVKERVLSASRLKTLETCSWSYWCNYHLKLPQKQNEGALRGTVCHLVFEMLVKKKKDDGNTKLLPPWSQNILFSIHCVLLGAAVTLQLTQKIRQLNLWQ